jgi:class 3 adenylate cyclase
VVTRLKQGESTIVEDIDDASILFADIVNFSAMADTMEAFEVVSMLNVLFSVFDELSIKHNVEKIKTIGDAYMVGSNVSIRNAAHAEALANLALDMQDKIRLVSLHLNKELHIRIGIATGPLVAGIIGISTRVSNWR